MSHGHSGKRSCFLRKFVMERAGQEEELKRTENEFGFSIWHTIAKSYGWGREQRRTVENISGGATGKIVFLCRFGHFYKKAQMWGFQEMDHGAAIQTLIPKSNLKNSLLKHFLLFQPIQTALQLAVLKTPNFPVTRIKTPDQPALRWPTRFPLRHLVRRSFPYRHRLYRRRRRTWGCPSKFQQTTQKFFKTFFKNPPK